MKGNVALRSLFQLIVLACVALGIGSAAPIAELTSPNSSASEAIPENLLGNNLILNGYITSGTGETGFTAPEFTAGFNPLPPALSSGCGGENTCPALNSQTSLAEGEAITTDLTAPLSPGRTGVFFLYTKAGVANLESTDSIPLSMGFGASNVFIYVSMD